MLTTIISLVKILRFKQNIDPPFVSLVKLTTLQDIILGCDDGSSLVWAFLLVLTFFFAWPVQSNQILI